MILDLARQGLTVSAIARHTGLDRKTIRKYIAKGLEPPAYTPRPPRPTLVGPDRVPRDGVGLASPIIAIPGGLAGGFRRPWAA